MSRPEVERALWAILDTLREYADDLVLIGGWVPYLHLTYGSAAGGGAHTSLTAEADLMLPVGLRRGERRPIVQILEEAGFHPLGRTGVVWAREPERGETIEFLQSHRGPAGSRGQAAPIAEQPGLRALSLDHLWVLEASTESLIVPAPEEGGMPAPVRVPSLAAFVLNKANTFNLRGGPEGRLKGGKDLVYLRDIMAAGDAAQPVVANDLQVMLADEQSARVAAHLQRAIVHLRNVAARFHPSASEILAERDGMTPADARADVEGHLRDLIDLLSGREPG